MQVEIFYLIGLMPDGVSRQQIQQIWAYNCDSLHVTDILDRLIDKSLI